MSEAPALNLLFFGTPEFAVPSLRALVESRHHVVGVISQPDRPQGRGRKSRPTPVRAESERHGLELFQPEKVGDPSTLEWMREREPELGIVVAFGQFIPKTVRELPPLRLVNAHASLLPKHRGAAPIQYAILSGDQRTGISVMQVEREMDAGDVCLVRELRIGSDETAGELSDRLAQLAGEALLEAVDQISSGRAVFRAQDRAAASLAPKLDKEFGRISWQQPVAEILNRIRAVTPWPGAELMLRQAGRLKILAARAGEGPRGRVGQVRSGHDVLSVHGLDGWVDVLKLQVPGKRPLDAAEYLRGARVPVDEEAA